MKNIFTFKNIIIGFGLIVLDLFVYIILGTMLMGYDDFYHESKGEYFSLESMTFWQKVNYIGLHFWHVVNVVFIIILIYKLIVKINSHHKIEVDSKTI